MAMKWIEKITLRKEDLRGERIPWITKETVALAEKPLPVARQISHLPEVRLVELPGPVIRGDIPMPAYSEPERSPYLDLRELSRRIMEEDVVIERPSRAVHMSQDMPSVSRVSDAAVSAPKGITTNRITSIEKDSFIESAIPVRYLDIETRGFGSSRSSNSTHATGLLRNEADHDLTGMNSVYDVEDYVKAAEESTRVSIADTFEEAYRKRVRERGGDDEEYDDKPVDDGEITSRTHDDDDEDLPEPDDEEITSRGDEDDEITARADDDDDEEFSEPDDEEITSKIDDDAAAREKIAKLEKIAAVSTAAKAAPSGKKAEEIKDTDEIVSAKVFENIPINEEYIIPMRFLHTSPKHDRASWETEIRRNSELLVKTLNDFGIESRVSAVNRGPVVTLYEMQLAPGIKVTRIVSLADDIALALAASRVRVVAPIPGKAAIGIEVPNSLREMVTLGDIINTTEYKTVDMILKIAMGKDILGKPVMIDLKKQPHLLIAGATGAGKSVCVNGVIVSLICNYDPNHIRFIMIDPKMVELQLYNGLPHLLTPVITDPDDAPKALKWAIMEMERRYKLLSEQCTRDIDKYNQKIASMRHPEEFEHLPYIVIIIDEFADLMMVAAKEVENYVTRIAQKARAIGIHLVLATQRPSVDVITGIIKANFPARVAFQVAQKTDSRTIIDQNGAEKLLGRGDMLYQSPTSSFPVRIQGAFLSEDEIMSIVQRACMFGRPRYIDFDEYLKEEAAAEEDADDIRDEMFADALKIVSDSKKASASYLQRRLSIGYNRAARIVERMEELGYVGPQQGSKPREVYV